MKMTMIEASTRYLREYVDSLFMQLPFDPEIAGDFQGETEQRVRAMAGDDARSPTPSTSWTRRARFAMVYKAQDIEAQIARDGAAAGPRARRGHARAGLTPGAMELRRSARAWSRALPMRIPHHRPGQRTARERISRASGLHPSTAPSTALNWRRRCTGAWRPGSALGVQWDDVQGYEVVLGSRPTKEQVDKAKREMAPDVWSGLNECRTLAEAPEAADHSAGRQRLRRGVAVYTLMSGA